MAAVESPPTTASNKIPRSRQRSSNYDDDLWTAASGPLRHDQIAPPPQQPSSRSSPATSTSTTAKSTNKRRNQRFETTPAAATARSSSANRQPQPSSLLGPDATTAHHHGPQHYQSHTQRSSASQQHLATRHHASNQASSSSPHLNQHRSSGFGRHREHHDRAEHRYDADFDRSIGVQLAPQSGVGPSASSSNRLYNPDAPPGSSQPQVRVPDSAQLPTQAPARRDDGRRARSKREPVELADLGRRAIARDRDRERDSRESLESEESGLSASRGHGRPGSRSSKEVRPRRSRREGGEKRRGEEAEGGGGSSSSLLTPPTPTSMTSHAPHPPALVGLISADRPDKPRQLFDPRRDDPVKFAASVPNGSTMALSANATRKHHNADTRSLAASSVVSLSAPSVISTSDIGVEEQHSHPSQQSASPNPVVAQLKRAYREITDLEAKLQDEHKAAMAAQSRDDDAGQGLRIQGGGGAKRFDDEYWVKLASGHKALADAHYSFLQMALDPRLPASLQALPQRYNIPTRLWQVAFHQLLERMRHAIVSPAANSTSSASSANVLEHLIEFIQYAYGHYSQLFEDPSIAIFRSAWIEQLGDLARYRMAVAGLSARVNATQSSSSSRPRQVDGRQLKDRNVATHSRSQSPERDVDAASIGLAALNDWDVEEQESWRVIARDWYGQGLAETPGTGRLQHHLALLSKGDELRSLYHYAKSLTAAHPYVSARESILPLFEDEHQARRTRPDVTKAELFVHLHGMLFTKIALDDFDEVNARLIERLVEEGCLLRRGSHAGEDFRASMKEAGEEGAEPFGDAEWTMLAIINISAMLQYGAEDGVLRRLTAKESSSPPNASKSTTSRTASKSGSRGRSAAAVNGTKQLTPQAIMLNSSSLRKSEVASNDGAIDSTDDVETSPRLGAPGDNIVMHLNTASVTAPMTSPEEDPVVFRLALRLTFSMLDLAFREGRGLRTIAGGAQLINPYVILVLTFVAHMAQHPPALRHIERAVPWHRIVSFLNQIPDDVEVRMDVQAKLLGSPLPEDWCLRGMDWTGRNLFGRGYWRSKPVSNGASRRADDMAPPPINPPPSTAVVESEMDALKFDPAVMDEGDNFDEGVSAHDVASTPSTRLAASRWKRVAVLGAWLARNVAGLDFDAMAQSSSKRFSVTGSLEAKSRRWRREDEEAAEAERASQKSAWAKMDPSEADDSSEDESSEEDEDEEDENDSVAVRELKARRRQLKAVIKQARQSTRDSSSSIRRLSSKRKTKNSRTTLKLFPGYTVLVFDTNILLTSMKLFRDLVEAAKWTVVVPLAVVTELDGLRKNSSPLGSAATEAIEYLETTIKSHSRFLKVQTSRGNYLRDLSIRSESIDFSAGSDSLAANGNFSHDFARSMDDVILKAVAWQKEHFTNRLALVNPSADRRQVPSDASQVVLVSFDRNLRLKANARGLDAADESGTGMLLDADVRDGPIANG